MEVKILIPIILSCLALGMSILTVYFSLLQPAALRVIAGEHINLSTFKEGNCAVNLPVRIAIIRRLALLVQRSGSAEGYLLEPVFYEHVDDDGNFKHESQATPIAVIGRSTDTKQILFRSSLERPEEFRFAEAGSYQMTILGWLKGKPEPQVTDTFTVTISNATLADLERYRAEKSTSSVRLQQSEWQRWSAQKITQADVSNLGVRSV